MAVARAASKLCLFFSTASTQEVKIVSLRTASHYHSDTIVYVIFPSFSFPLLKLESLKSSFSRITAVYLRIFLKKIRHPQLRLNCLSKVRSCKRQDLKDVLQKQWKNFQMWGRDCENRNSAYPKDPDSLKLFFVYFVWCILHVSGPSVVEDWED